MMIYRSLCTAVVLSSWLLAQVSPSAPSTAAKQEQQSSAPTIVTRTQLVLVPVVVTDKSGKHIERLTRDAFRLEENGKEQTVSVFDEVRTETLNLKTALPSQLPDVHSNFALSEVRPYRVTIIVLDLINTPFLSQGVARQELIKYLARSLRRDEPTTLLGLGRNGVRQLHPFTTDTTVLIAALRKMNGEVSKGDMNGSGDPFEGSLTPDVQSAATQEMQTISNFVNDEQAVVSAFQLRDSIRTTLRGLHDIARAYSALPGRKTLLWATAGFPFMIDDPMQFNRMGLDMVHDYDEAWRALMAANIAVYPVDVTGLSTGLPRRYDYRQQQQTTLRAFASATGGRPCMNNNDLEKCYGLAVEDSTAYYMLGFYLAPNDRKPGWRNLKVRVSAEGAHVHAREGFYMPGETENSDDARRKVITEALSSPIEFTGVRFSVRPVPPAAGASVTDAKSKTIYDFLFILPLDSFFIDRQNSNHIDLDLALFAITKPGKVASENGNRILANMKTETLAHSSRDALRIRGKLELSPGEYQVKAIVRDNQTSQIGTVSFEFPERSHAESPRGPAASN